MAGGEPRLNLSPGDADRRRRSRERLRERESPRYMLSVHLRCVSPRLGVHRSSCRMQSLLLVKEATTRRKGQRRCLCIGTAWIRTMLGREGWMEGVWPLMGHLWCSAHQVGTVAGCRCATCAPDVEGRLFRRAGTVSLGTASFSQSSILCPFYNLRIQDNSPSFCSSAHWSVLSAARTLQLISR